MSEGDKPALNHIIKTAYKWTCQWVLNIALFWKSRTPSVNDSVYHFDCVFLDSEKLYCGNVVNVPSSYNWTERSVWCLMVDIFMMFVDMLPLDPSSEGCLRFNFIGCMWIHHSEESFCVCLSYHQPKTGGGVGWKWDAIYSWKVCFQLSLMHYYIRARRNTFC